MLDINIYSNNSFTFKKISRNTQSKGFAVTVVKNRGAYLEFYFDLDEVLNWLQLIIDTGIDFPWKCDSPYFLIPQFKYLFDFLTNHNSNNEYRMG